MTKSQNQLLKKIRRSDMFGSPIHMEFQGTKEGVFQTLGGGIASILLNAFILWLFTSYFIQMVTFGNNNIYFNETVVNFQELGPIYPIGLGNIPFYRFKYNGKMLK